MTEATTDAGRDRHELWAAIVLGVAGVLTAAAAFRGALIDDEVLAGFSEANRLNTDANGFYSDALQTAASDEALFLEYQIQNQSGDVELAEGIRGSLFTPELEEAVAAWESDPEAVSPFDEGGGYVNPDLDQADALVGEAEAAQADAEDADEASDRFELAAVFFAVSLFFAGISSLLRTAIARRITLVSAVVLIVPGVIAMVVGQAAA